jgi:hypothetical protein
MTRDGGYAIETAQEGAMIASDDIWDDLFHGAAWRAFAELIAEQGFPPDMEAVRRRCYAYYEEELGRKNGGRRRPGGCPG